MMTAIRLLCCLFLFVALWTAVSLKAEAQISIGVFNRPAVITSYTGTAALRFGGM